MADAQPEASQASKQRQVITIDGLAASGKSSAAKGLAHALGIAYVSSGLLYRAATWLALYMNVDIKNLDIKNLDTKDEETLLATLKTHSLTLIPHHDRDNRVTVELDGQTQDISHELETSAIDAAVSHVAKHPRVRAWVDTRLRALRDDFVIDGRDMGMVVFPVAQVKFYLHASAEVRAKRRLNDRDEDFNAAVQAINERDARDAQQSKPARDAIHIDTDDMTLEQVIATMLGHVRNLTP
jgi:CMP/dCMP kinase